MDDSDIDIAIESMQFSAPETTKGCFRPKKTAVKCKILAHLKYLPLFSRSGLARVFSTNTLVTK